ELAGRQRSSCRAVEQKVERGTLFSATHVRRAFVQALEVGNVARNLPWDLKNRPRRRSLPDSLRARGGGAEIGGAIDVLRELRMSLDDLYGVDGWNGQVGRGVEEV